MALLFKLGRTEKKNALDCRGADSMRYVSSSLRLEIASIFLSSVPYRFKPGFLDMRSVHSGLVETGRLFPGPYSGQKFPCSMVDSRMVSTFAGRLGQFIKAPSCPRRRGSLPGPASRR